MEEFAVDRMDDSIREGNGIGDVWAFEQTFNSKAELDAFLKEENCWIVRDISRLRTGIKTSFMCRLALKNAVPCNAGLFIIFDGVTHYRLFRRSLEHTHVEIVRLDNVLKDKILDLRSVGHKPSNIRAMLMDDETNRVELTTRQIKAVIRHHQKFK